jgi:hypothetical protein
VECAEHGLIDADLGGGVIKQRAARQSQGKSSGWRTLILFRPAERAIFAFGFAKNAQANISAEDEALLKKAAAQALSWDDAQLDRLVACKELTEIGHEPEG